jgi:hypothetical protein
MDIEEKCGLGSSTLAYLARGTEEKYEKPYRSGLKAKV